ncbi:MAG TPA: ATP-binding protein [Candidatus Saccharimonadales bacterium]|jgi:serine/threonine-protein kinase RsbW|nr:ATP-binding protein [Candidatus Saccharimonadales bacterium]
MKTFLRPNTSNNQEREPGQRGSLLLVMALYSNPKWLSTVRAAVERLTATLGFKEEHCRSVTRALDEALTNIVRHAYNNRHDQPITMYFRKVQRKQEVEVQYGIEITLCDRGPACDATKWHGRSPGEIRPGGLGLQIIHDAMDIVEFSRKGNTNRLRLVKYLGQAGLAP